MNAWTAFADREDELLARLEAAKDMGEAEAACAMALEQVACTLAQDEQEDHARQRQQAVMAVARRAPQLLRAATARGEIVLSEPEALSKAGGKIGARQAMKLLGAFLLGALAVYELINGRPMFALTQLAGSALLLAGGRGEGAQAMHARAIPTADAQRMVRLMREICQAVDVCAGDLALLEKEAGLARLCGTADDAMLDLLSALMEAKASGRGELALRSLSQAEQYLHMLGVELIGYDATHAQLFDTLPTMDAARTIRPAMMQDGRVLRRGVAAIPMERGMGA